MRKERDQPRKTEVKKRKELQVQVNKALLDKEQARVADLEKILAESELRNREHEENLKRKKARTTPKTAKKPVANRIVLANDQETKIDPQEARLELLMRQLYSGQ